MTAFTGRIGVDTYSYHRLLGELRPGERPVSETWTLAQTKQSALRSGAEAIAYETCFLNPPDIASDAFAEIPVPFMFSWGHPYGLEFGTSKEAEHDAMRWIDVSARVGASQMRIVIAHPALREALWNSANRQRSIAALRRLCDAAASLDVRLAIENHADVTAVELREVIDDVGDPELGVCFDIANALRVGDDPEQAAEVLAPFMMAMHVKDVDLSESWGVTGPASTPLGTGSLPLSSVIDTVLETNPGVWLLVELAHLVNAPMDEEEWVSRDIAWIRSAIESRGARREGGPPR